MDPLVPRPDRVTSRTLAQMRADGRRIACLTAYDFTTAAWLDEAGVDVLLVGDTLGMTVQGRDTTLGVTVDEAVYHCRCVSAAASRALVVGDMPFMSYQPSAAVALANAGRLVKEGGAAAVKLEGGLPVAGTVRALVAADVPVMGHVGLTPQSYHRMGGFRVQGREAGDGPGSRSRVLADARALDDAGVFAIVVEGVPSDLASEITAAVSAPTIGIGAGPGCSGQVLVLHDMLGLTRGRVPKFVKRYAALGELTAAAAREYVREVRDGAFPGEAHGYAPEKPRG